MAEETILGDIPEGNVIVNADQLNELIKYHRLMSEAMDELAITLGNLGCRVPGADNTRVYLTCRELGTLFDLARASGLSKGIMRAVMSE